MCSTEVAALNETRVSIVQLGPPGTDVTVKKSTDVPRTLKCSVVAAWAGEVASAPRTAPATMMCEVRMVIPPISRPE